MILVTGATGFVGSALVRALVAGGAAVRVLRRPTSRLDLLGGAAREVQHALGDVTDPASVRDAMDGVDLVYHVAAVVAFGPAARRALRAVNVRGTAHVVDAALDAGVGRLVHTSSIAALGRPEHAGGAIDETAVWTPSRQNTAYAASKRDAELEVLRAVAEGLDATTINPALVFGPGARPDEGTGRLVARVAAGRLPLAPPGGTAVVDVADVVAGLRAAAERGGTGERYVLASENLSWTAILGTLAAALGAAPPRATVPPALLRLAGALGSLGGAVTRSEPPLTQATARTAAETHRYANGKAVRELGVTFRPFAETAARIAEASR
ncbi:SDR family NAD(P)-dependent oxidoreductase [Rubrivirga litoralis]|uniref:SDR family NAD(P)-dependent oxidoreductase n=1 Tax=Rubrivirga litoralis TaxID=3075598 RepID=A0ABU3BS15_9BACT|nr:SDR family NAD(P)-dependent oxidoreductase [Rubrivirga sp. F394]MDT0632084.1 SDR family NAD(P)-dependent oxidoreductase [Rubrivirga sp. F394]